MSGYLVGIVTVTGILALIYLVWRLLHSAGGRGASVGPQDIFLATYCAFFLSFIMAEFWEIQPGLVLLAVIGIMFPVMWILMSSQKARGSLWSGVKNWTGI